MSSRRIDRTIQHFFPFPLLPLFLLVGVFYVNFVSRVTIAPLLSVIKADLGLGLTGAGSLFFWTAAGYCAGLFASGFVTSYLTYRRAILLSAGLMGIVMVVLSMAASLAILCVALFFAGLSAGLYLPSGISILTELVAQEHLGRAMAVHELAPNLAFVTAPVLAEILLKIVSWRGTLAILGSMSFLMGLIFWYSGKGGEYRGESPRVNVMWGIIRKPSFWAAAAFFIVAVGSSLGVYSMLPLFLVSESAMSREFANMLIAVSRTAGFVTLFLSGWVADRAGYRLAMVLSVLLAGGLTFLIGFFSDSWTLPLWVLLQAPSAVCTFPAGFVMLSMIFPPSQRNLAMSMVIMIGFLTGGGVFPMGIGYIAEQLSFSWSFSLLGLTILSVIPLLYLFRVDKRESPSDVVV